MAVQMLKYKHREPREDQVTQVQVHQHRDSKREHEQQISKSIVFYHDITYTSMAELQRPRTSLIEKLQKFLNEWSKIHQFMVAGQSLGVRQDIPLNEKMGMEILVYGKDPDRINMVVNDALRMTIHASRLPQNNINLITLKGADMSAITYEGFRAIVGSEYRKLQQPDRFLIVLENFSPGMIWNFLMSGVLTYFKQRGIGIYVLCWSASNSLGVSPIGRAVLKDFLSKVFIPSEPAEESWLEEVNDEPLQIDQPNQQSGDSNGKNSPTRAMNQSSQTATTFLVPKSNGNDTNGPNDEITYAELDHCHSNSAKKVPCSKGHSRIGTNSTTYSTIVHSKSDHNGKESGIKNDSKVFTVQPVKMNEPAVKFARDDETVTICEIEDDDDKKKGFCSRTLDFFASACGLILD